MTRLVTLDATAPRWRGGVKDHVAIGLVRRGWLTFRSGGQLLHASAGAAGILAPGVFHEEVDRARDLEMDVLLFDVSSAGNTRIASRREAAKLWSLRDEVAKGTPVCAQLEATLAHHVQAPRLPPLVRRVVAQMRTDLHQPFRVDRMARELGVDRFQLSRLFVDSLGVAPYAYLTHLRVARARTLLATGNSPAEAAHLLGYCDQSQLHRHFMRIVGETPGRFARRSRRAHHGRYGGG